MTYEGDTIDDILAVGVYIELHYTFILSLLYGHSTRFNFCRIVRRILTIGFARDVPAVAMTPPNSQTYLTSTVLNRSEQ